MVAIDASKLLFEIDISIDRDTIAATSAALFQLASITTVVCVWIYVVQDVRTFGLLTMCPRLRFHSGPMAANRGPAIRL